MGFRQRNHRASRELSTCVWAIKRDWDVVTLKFECLYDLYNMEWERFKFEIVSLKVECLYGTYIIKSWVYNIDTVEN